LPEDGFHSISFLGLQCCANHMEAAEAGHLLCLKRMKQEGRLLACKGRLRRVAGEARRAELWDAALTACKAGQAHVLSWLVNCCRWPSSVDATSEFSFSGLAQLPEGGKLGELDIPRMQYKDEWFLAEVNLWRFALQNPDTACLEALLDAGCRSEWVCPLAAVEGREGHLALAVRRGCCCDERTI
jgi:hypothetical protein